MFCQKQFYLLPILSHTAVLIKKLKLPYKGNFYLLLNSSQSLEVGYLLMMFQCVVYPFILESYKQCDVDQFYSSPSSLAVLKLKTPSPTINKNR